MLNYSTKTVLALFSCYNHEKGEKTETPRSIHLFKSKPLLCKHIPRQSTVQTIQRQGSSKDEIKKNSDELKNPELFIQNSSVILHSALCSELILSMYCKWT